MSGTDLEQADSVSMSPVISSSGIDVPARELPLITYCYRQNAQIFLYLVEYRVMVRHIRTTRVKTIQSTSEG